jgi:hypothetical protein
MSYNGNLAYFLNRVSGVSTNIFKLEPNNSADSIGPNKIIRFALPSNCLLNMKSLALHFNASATGTGARLPAKIETLVDRVELSSGGVMISQGTNFTNAFIHLRDALTKDNTDPVLGHPEIVRAKSYVDGAAKTNNESYDATNGKTQFCITRFPGFIESCEPGILDTSLMPDITVSLYLAGKEVLSSSIGQQLGGNFHTDASDATYVLNNLHLNVETLGLADQTYDKMVESMIAQKGYIEIPFKQYMTFSSQHSGTTRFTVATQSLDKVWVGWRPNGYDTLGAPVKVNGYKGAGAQVGENELGIPGYDVGGVMDTNKEKYLGKYYNFKEVLSGSNPATFQFKFNGALVPQFAATTEDMYQITKNSVFLPGEGGRHAYSLDQYRNNYFGQCIRLNLPDSEAGREISGLDTRGLSLSAYLDTKNLASDIHALIVCEVSSSLRVGASRQINLLQ